MRQADEYTIQVLDVPSLLLMERAGVALAEEAERLCQGGKILCICGGGNNGGDGFVCARILKNRGLDVAVLCYAEKYSPDCQINLEKWKALGGEMVDEIPDTVGCLVDCLYGTGFHGKLEGRDWQTVQEINRLHGQGVPVLSADIPSGVHGDTGCVQGCAVEADVTLCIGERKLGTLLGDGIDYAGQCKRVDIGITLPNEEDYAELLTKRKVATLLPKRMRNSHKGSYGKTAIVGGSTTYSGAPYLSALACLRSGVGYTTLFTPSALIPSLLFKCPELLLKSTNEGGMYAFTEESMQTLLPFDSIAYGMGMGVSEEVAKGAVWLLQHYEGKLILDADGLNSLATYHKGELSTLFQRKTCDVLLTPHVKEFSRLSGISVYELQSTGISTPKAIAESWKVNLLLKNAVSLLTNGQACFLNEAGCSGQAKGGSGDVLAGVIAGLAGMGLSTLEAGMAGAYLTGKAAEFGAQEWGDFSLTPSDVIAYLGRAFLFVTENTDEERGEE